MTFKRGGADSKQLLPIPLAMSGCVSANLCVLSKIYLYMKRLDHGRV